jgi:hypothetical protein
MVPEILRSLTPEILERIEKQSLASFEARAFDLAREGMEILALAGALTIPMQLTYAVCLTELGRDESARDVLRIARDEIASLDDADPARRVLASLAATMAPWIAGGAHAPEARRTMRSSAEKWLPRLGRSEATAAPRLEERQGSRAPRRSGR